MKMLKMLSANALNRQGGSLSHTGESLPVPQQCILLRTFVKNNPGKTLAIFFYEKHAGKYYF
jgi:hypothetical protein